MSRILSRAAVACTLTAMLHAPKPVAAQWYGGQNNCVCAQPVVQTCYQNVPVTEYRQYKQVVQRPVYDTKYVDQKVTAYRPISEKRTVNVPTVNYQTVTEHRTVSRNAGFWHQESYCRHMPSPCEYDRRPGFMGWLNRTGYNIRSAFTPRVVNRRRWIPQTIVQTIPYNRQVAVRGTRKVTYNVTRYEPYTTTRKVAVRSVRYVAQEITRTQPVTVMRRVPIGTSVAYQWTPYGGATATALAPTPDPIGTGRRRTANSRNGKYEDESAVPGRRFERDSSKTDGAKPNPTGVRRSSHVVPADPRSTFISRPQAGFAQKLPSVVQAGRWIARRRPAPSTSAAAQQHGGPSLIGPAVSDARSYR